MSSNLDHLMKLYQCQEGTIQDKMHNFYFNDTFASVTQMKAELIYCFAAEPLCHSVDGVDCGLDLSLINQNAHRQ